MEEKGKEARKQEFFAKLLKALDVGTHGTFAAFEAFKPSQRFDLRSIQVQGAGDLQIPLSVEDASKLRRVCEQAPFKRGSATVDTTVRRCWQVDASKVSFPQMPTFLSSAIQALAMRAVCALGVDGASVQLEAHLYKLLFYESDGHVTLHRDTENERGMFATMILQLPTAAGYTGGELLVKHNDEVKRFNSQMVSALGFCCTTFFADCLHELRKIKSGSRLCLAFDLIRHDRWSEPVLRGLISRRVQQAEAALEPWLKVATDEELNFVGAQLAFPLQNKYTTANLSIAGLKGNDIILAEVLKNVRDQNKQKSLDLCLCLATRSEFATRSAGSYCRRSGSSCDSNGTDDASGWHSMDEILKPNIEFKKWIGEDDQPTSVAWIEELTVDFDNEVVVEKQWDHCLFDSYPDKSKYDEGYVGNSGPTLEFLYNAAILVVWSKALSISLLCERDVSHALASLQIRDPNFSGKLREIIRYCQRNPFQVWYQQQDRDTDSVTPGLLRWCARENLHGDAREIIMLLMTQFNSFKIGVRSAEVWEAIDTLRDAIRDSSLFDYALATWVEDELAREATIKRVETRPKVFVDPTVNTLPDGAHNKRAKTTTGSNEIIFIDLSSDDDGEHGG